jgi:Concanavalin A-like lectin/glucanases superfamily
MSVFDISYFVLLGDDCPENTDIPLNQWTHIAFVFENNSRTQSIYIDEVLNVNRTASESFKANPSAVTIGSLLIANNISGPNYFKVRFCVDNIIFHCACRELLIV